VAARRNFFSLNVPSRNILGQNMLGKKAYATS